MAKYPPLSQENYALEVTTFLKVHQLTLRIRQVAESLECSLPTFNRLISGMSKPTEKAIKETEKMMKLTEISNFEDYSKIPASERQKVVEKINSDGPTAAGGAAATMAVVSVAGGVSAAAISSTLATIGSAIGGGMLSGIAVLAAVPLAIGTAAVGVDHLVNHVSHERRLNSTEIDSDWEFISA